MKAHFRWLNSSLLLLTAAFTSGILMGTLLGLHTSPIQLGTMAALNESWLHTLFSVLWLPLADPIVADDTRLSSLRKRCHPAEQRFRDPGGSSYYRPASHILCTGLFPPL